MFKRIIYRQHYQSIPPSQRPAGAGRQSCLFGANIVCISARSTVGGYCRMVSHPVPPVAMTCSGITLPENHRPRLILALSRPSTAALLARVVLGLLLGGPSWGKTPLSCSRYCSRCFSNETICRIYGATSSAMTEVPCSNERGRSPDTGAE